MGRMQPQPIDFRNYKENIMTQQIKPQQIANQLKHQINRSLLTEKQKTDFYDLIVKSARTPETMRNRLKRHNDRSRSAQKTFLKNQPEFDKSSLIKIEKERKEREKLISKYVETLQIKEENNLFDDVLTDKAYLLKVSTTLTQIAITLTQIAAKSASSGRELQRSEVTPLFDR